MKQREVLEISQTTTQPYERAINALHTDTRQGSDGYLYHARHLYGGGGTYFALSAYERKGEPVQECHCSEDCELITDEGIEVFPDCCYCLDDESDCHCDCFSTDAWKLDNEFCHLYRNRLEIYDLRIDIPLWVIDCLRKEW